MTQRWSSFPACSNSRLAQILHARLGVSSGAWGEMEQSINTLIDDLLWPTTEVTRVVAAVAKGDLLQTARLDVDGRPLKGEFLHATTIVNTYVNVTKGMKEQLTKLVNADTLSKSDAQFVENTVEVLDLVLREANDLKDYIASGKQNDAQAYDGSRKKAWKEIKTLLSIKD